MKARFLLPTVVGVVVVLIWGIWGLVLLLAAAVTLFALKGLVNA